MGGCGFGSPAGETRDETVSRSTWTIRSRARVEHPHGQPGGCASHSGTPKLMTGKFAYNVPEWKPVVDYKAGSGELMLSQPGYSASFGNSVNNWDVTLNGDVPLEVIGHLGAGEANLELGSDESEQRRAQHRSG